MKCRSEVDSSIQLKNIAKVLITSADTSSQLSNHSSCALHIRLTTILLLLHVSYAMGTDHSEPSQKYWE